LFGLQGRILSSLVLLDEDNGLLRIAGDTFAQRDITLCMRRIAS